MLGTSTCSRRTTVSSQSTLSPTTGDIPPPPYRYSTVSAMSSSNMGSPTPSSSHGFVDEKRETTTSHLLSPSSAAVQTHHHHPATTPTTSSCPFSSAPNSPATTLVNSPLTVPTSPSTPNTTTTTTKTTDSHSVLSSISSKSWDGSTLRVKTIGSQISSGFPYHPKLYDLHIRPDEWDVFQKDVVAKTKMSAGDKALVVAAASATVLTGSISGSLWVGATMRRKQTEKAVKRGIESDSVGSLGRTLKEWNASYFREKGLFAHLELSESATKHKEKEGGEEQTKTFRRPSMFYSSKEKRDQKRDERKFVVVLTPLDPESGLPREAIHQLAKGDNATGEVIAEMPAGENNGQVLGMRAELSADAPERQLAEMPGEGVGGGVAAAELPGDSSTIPNQPVYEMDGSTVEDLKRLNMVVDGGDDGNGRATTAAEGSGGGGKMTA